MDAEAHIAQYVTVLAHLLLWAVQRACRRFASGKVTKAECPDWKRAYAPSTAHISPSTARCSGCGSPSAPSWQRASGGRPAALRVTDDTARHLRYTSRAKREADVSLSHRCTMEHHDATGVSPRDKRCEKLVRTGINGCSAMARPLTHLTHGISTRRPFHPAKTCFDRWGSPLFGDV